jgi:hypothetical protein
MVGEGEMVSSEEGTIMRIRDLFFDQDARKKGISR